MPNYLICYEYISRKPNEILGKLRKAKTIVEAQSPDQATALCRKALEEADKKNTILSVEPIDL